MPPREDGLLDVHLHQSSTTPMNIGVLDRNLRFIELNEIFASFYNTSAPDAVGRAVSEIVPVLAPVLEPLVLRVFSTNEPVEDAVVQDQISEGREVRTCVDCLPIRSRNGAVVAVDVFMHEVPPEQLDSMNDESDTTYWNSSEQLQHIVEAAGLGYWEWSAETDRIVWGGQHYELFGLAPGTFGGTYHDFLELVYPDDREHVAQALSRSRDEGTRYVAEFRIVLPCGTVRWMLNRGRWVAHDSAPPTHLRGIVADITERKRQEEMCVRLLNKEQSAREKAEQRTIHQRQLYDQALEARARLELLAEANNVLAASLDYEDTLAAVAQLLVPQIADYCVLHIINERDVYQQVASTHINPQKQPLLDAIGRLSIGEHHDPRSLFGSVVRTREPLLMQVSSDEQVAASIDVDEKFQIYQKLAPTSFMIVPLIAREHVIGTVTLGMAESQQHYDQHDLMFVQDLADRCALAVDNARLYAAERAARTTAEHIAARLERLHAVTASLSRALTPEQVARVIVEQGKTALGARAGTVGLLTDDDTALETLGSAGFTADELSSWGKIPMTLSAPIVDAVRSRELILLRSPDEWSAAYPHMAEVPRATGDHSWAAIPLIIKEGVLGSIALRFAEARDFDEEDRAWMMTLAQQCAQAMERARLYAREQRARLEAEDAVRVRDEIVALVSHDLKNPLTAILGRAHHAKRRLATTPPSLEQASKSLDMISDLTERMSLQIEDLLDVARLRAGATLGLQRRPVDLVALVQQIAAESQQTTEHHRIVVAAPFPDLVGRLDVLRLERVVRNLLDNALKYSPKGGEIILGLARETDAAGDWAILTVRDHGVGIPAADLPRVFERFHRASNVNGYIAGTGLGLASVRQIVEQHGGTVTASSKLGKGTTFTVRLPI